MNVDQLHALRIQPELTRVGLALALGLEVPDVGTRALKGASGS